LEFEPRLKGAGFRVLEGYGVIALAAGCASKTPMLGNARFSGGLGRAVKFERGIVENF
jgi:hypothetical protein